MIPLLLWSNCYYLGSPISLSPPEIQQLSDRTNTAIQIIPITDQSYRTWFHAQGFDTKQISTTATVNPLTGEREQENISEITELHLSKATDQIDRIKTILSGALRNRASDIHLEPTQDGLRIRYRIDGILRDVTTLPSEISRRVIVALKVMCHMDISESRRPQDGRIRESYTTDQEAEVGLDMRVSTLPCVSGEKAVIRLLPQRNPFSQIEDLGVFSENIDYLQKMVAATSRHGYFHRSYGFWEDQYALHQFAGNCYRTCECNHGRGSCRIYSATDHSNPGA